MHTITRHAVAPSATGAHRRSQQQQATLLACSTSQVQARQLQLQQSSHQHAVAVSRGVPEAGAAARRSVSTCSLPSSLDAPCAQVTCAVKFYHLSETNDFKDFASIVTPDVKWR